MIQMRAINCLDRLEVEVEVQKNAKQHIQKALLFTVWREVTAKIGEATARRAAKDNVDDEKGHAQLARNKRREGGQGLGIATEKMG